MVADTLDDGGDAGVADAEPLAHDAPQVDRSRRAAEADHVAGDDVVFRHESGRDRIRGTHDNPSARKALADEVVGVALQPQRDARRHESAEAVARRPGERDLDRVVGRPCTPCTLVTSWPSIVPTVRFTLLMLFESEIGVDVSIACRHSEISAWSSALSRPWS